MTGFADLDGVLVGFLLGTLVVVGGRPGLGKTVLTTSAAEKVTAERRGRRGRVQRGNPADELLAKHPRSPDLWIFLSGGLDDDEIECLVVAQRALDFPSMIAK